MQQVYGLSKISVAGQTGGSVRVRYNNHLEEKVIVKNKIKFICLCSSVG